MGFWKQFFSLERPKLDSIDKEKNYTLSELIDILKTKTLTVGDGNQLVLKILEELVKDHEKPR